jgi:hypothetical protein
LPGGNPAQRFTRPTIRERLEWVVEDTFGVAASPQKVRKNFRNRYQLPITINYVSAGQSPISPIFNFNSSWGDTSPTTTEQAPTEPAGPATTSVTPFAQGLTQRR